MPGLRHCERETQAPSTNRHDAATFGHRHGSLYWLNERLDQRCPSELIATFFLRQLSEARRDISQMSALNKAPSPSPGNLLPASLADRQLDHIERMVRSVARANSAGAVHGMDRQYWESRLRALVSESALVAAQQHRVQRLLQDLAKRARPNALKQTAA
jgi:hypothetical protein